MAGEGQSPGGRFPAGQRAAVSPRGAQAARLARPTDPAADLPPDLMVMADRSGHQAEGLAAPGGAGSPRTRTVGGRARVANPGDQPAVPAGLRPSQGWERIATAPGPLRRPAAQPA